MSDEKLGSKPLSDTGAIVESEPRHPLEKITADYIASLRNIGQTVQMVIPHVAKWLNEETKKHEKKLSQFLPERAASTKEQNVSIETARDFADFTSTMRQLMELSQDKSIVVLSRSLFIQTFCEFDAFTGQLLIAIYSRNSDLLKGISREISLTDLLEYADLEAVKRAMLEKEIETFRRDSYMEQFEKLEKKFGLKLRGFPEWSEFVEMTQRRNVLTHNDGRVSDQYLSTCDREGYSFPKRPALGEELLIPADYFGKMLRIMTKIGCMLAHTLWSKVFPKESNEMHDSLNDQIYTCLQQKRWKTAADIGAFAMSEPMQRNISEICLRLRVVNVAISLKFSDREQDAQKILKSLDWSASYRDFKLALCVLSDRFDEAVSIMKSIGRSGELIRQHAYHDWPLFHKFRERPEFYETYEKIYGESFLAKVQTDDTETKKQSESNTTLVVKKRAVRRPRTILKVVPN